MVQHNHFVMQIEWCYHGLYESKHVHGMMKK